MTRYGSLSRPEQDHFSESSGFQKLCARMIDQAIKDMEGKIDLDAMEWWVHGDYGILPLRTCAAELGVTEGQIKNMAPEHTDWEPLKPLLDGLRVMRGLLALVKNASQDPESFEYYAAFKIMRDTMDSLRIDGFSDIYESGEW